MIVKHGIKNPNAKKNFLGLEPLESANMVQEKVAGFSPRSPQIPNYFFQKHFFSNFFDILKLGID